MAVSLRGGEGLNSKNLRAELLLKGGRAKLVPVSISMTGDGAQIEIKFPSIAQANLLFDDLEDRPLKLLYSKLTARYTLKEATAAEKVARSSSSSEQNSGSAGSKNSCLHTVKAVGKRG